MNSQIATYYCQFYPYRNYWIDYPQPNYGYYQYYQYPNYGYYQYYQYPNYSYYPYSDYDYDSNSDYDYDYDYDSQNKSLKKKNNNSQHKVNISSKQNDDYKKTHTNEIQNNEIQNAKIQNDESYPTEDDYSKPRSDRDRARIAEKNEELELFKFFEKEGETEIIDEQIHEQIKDEQNVGQNNGEQGIIDVNSITTIQAAIQCHNTNPNDKICLLNFADAYKPGGGYMNGRVAQEECICRQTLLYRSIKDSRLYDQNREDIKPENNDNMLYSPNVPVIRDDDCKLLEQNQVFRVNIISSAAVNNINGPVENASEIMEERIRKIVRLAASKKNDVLILGAFGCGVFKNNVNDISQDFKKVLIDEGLKNCFKKVVFPMVTSGYAYKTFKADLASDQE